jgi:hypothetical protein
MTGSALREALGFAGVVGSLVFVGLEIRQNTLATRAAAYQDMGTAISDVWLQGSQNPTLASLTLRSLEDPDAEFTPEEEAQIANQDIAALRQYEVVWRQVNLGVLDGEVLGYFGWDPRDVAVGRRWQRIRSFMSTDFREFLESARSGR